MQLIHGDCLEKMKDIPDKSIDMILCDLPYGTTACKWDVIIPFEPLWEQYKRVIKTVVPLYCLVINHLPPCLLRQIYLDLSIAGNGIKKSQRV